MRELFVHVGMHKTGTSAIQQTLHAHQALLQRHGFSWLNWHNPNHSRLVVSAFAERPQAYGVNRRLGLGRAQDAEGFAEQARATLREFLAQAPGPRLVISGEGIGFLDSAGMGRMLAAFRGQVDRITVIGFVRPPRSFVASAIQSHIRQGRTLDQLREARVAPRYRQRFAPLLAAPEVAAVRLHLYTPATLDQGCSVATFLRLLGAAPEIYPQMQTTRANAANSHLGGLLALAANEAVPATQPDGSANPQRATRLLRFLDGLGGPRFAVPEALIARCLEGSAEDIAWMEAQLGAPFAESEKQPGIQGGDAAPRMPDWEELKLLAGAINGLLAENDMLRTARRGAGAAQAGKRPGAAARRHAARGTP